MTKKDDDPSRPPAQQPVCPPKTGAVVRPAVRAGHRKILLPDAMAQGVDREKMLRIGLVNRAADNWQPLLAVAQLAGRAWLTRGLKACIGLGVNPKNARPLSRPEHLLADFYAYRQALLQSRWGRRKANGRAGQLLLTVPGEDAPLGLLSTSGFLEWLTRTPGYASPWAEGAWRADLPDGITLGAEMKTAPGATARPKG